MIYTFFPTLGFAAIVVFVFMTIAFIFSIIRKRNDVADTAWGLGFILVAVSTFFLNHNFFEKQLLVTLLVTIWGIRLSGHIYIRNRNKKEDHRYEKYRKEWKEDFYVRSYTSVFLTQGLLLLFISIPVIFINSNMTETFSWMDGLAVAIWLVGFIFESFGDYQLAQFIKNPAHKGRVMTRGLWKYTRHPNYFGEVTQWWGIFLLAATLPGGIFTIVGPLVITILITQISGIPLLEKHYVGNPEFEQYKARTSIFFPFPWK